MRKWQLVGALSVGIMASGSGVIQANAALYTFSVDFETKVVSDFSAYDQTYFSTTYDLGATITFNFAGSYNFSFCPAPITANAFYESYWRLNGTGSLIDYRLNNLPDFPCTTTITPFSSEITTDVSDQFVQAVIDDDANFAQLSSVIGISQTGSVSGLRLRFYNWTTYITLNYNFDTTYLFNYFLSDTQALAPFFSAAANWTNGADLTTKVDYVYTTAGNDEYRIVNTNLGSVGTSRKKYAVDYNMEYFRGESVGARIRHGFNTDAPYSYTEVLLTASGNQFLNNRWNYYYLNTANNSQAIVDVPEFNFEYEDCGSFLALNVGCFINNVLAYITNDAPIISDAITLLNAGMKLAGQAFGVIGSFSDNNVFGVLILGGLGLIAVRWFLKND